MHTQEVPAHIKSSEATSPTYPPTHAVNRHRCAQVCISHTTSLFVHAFLKTDWPCCQTCPQEIVHSPFNDKHGMLAVLSFALCLIWRHVPKLVTGHCVYFSFAQNIFKELTSYFGTWPHFQSVRRTDTHCGLAAAHALSASCQCMSQSGKGCNGAAFTCNLTY